jgi:hypothetical protein
MKVLREVFWSGRLTGMNEMIDIGLMVVGEWMDSESIIGIHKGMAWWFGGRFGGRIAGLM